MVAICVMSTQCTSQTEPSTGGLTTQACTDGASFIGMSKVNYIAANLAALAGLLTGAAVVHNIYQPDLVRSCAVKGSSCKPEEDASQCHNVKCKCMHEVVLI
jgi:Domain of unknown function (DUF4516)